MSLPFTAFLVVSTSFGQVEPAKWQNFRSEEGRYTVQSPSKPQTKVQIISSKHGKFKLTTHASDGPTTASHFSVSFADFPEAFVKEYGIKGTLHNMKKGILSKSSAKPSEKDIKLGEYPGLQFSAPFTASLKEAMVEGEIHGRVYLVGNRGYYLMVLGFKGNLPAPEDTNRFMDSFKLLPEKE